jgi:PAT family beta-lactamase induction signal transducer AmpG
VALEQLGYGFGFTAFMLVMAQFAEDSGRYKTSHYAIMTGFMALGMMIPGMFSGAIQAALGYKSFFLWVLVCVVPSVLVTLLAKRVVRASFGLKGQDA